MAAETHGRPISRVNVGKQPARAGPPGVARLREHGALQAERWGEGGRQEVRRGGAIQDRQQPGAFADATRDDLDRLARKRGGRGEHEHVRRLKDPAVRVLAVAAHDVQAGSRLGRRRQRARQKERRAPVVRGLGVADQEDLQGLVHPHHQVPRVVLDQIVRLDPGLAGEQAFARNVTLNTASAWSNGGTFTWRSCVNPPSSSRTVSSRGRGEQLKTVHTASAASPATGSAGGQPDRYDRDVLDRFRS